MRNIVYEKEKIKLDNGSYFGQGVFETILWLNKPVFLNEHIERLKIGMKVIGLEPLEEEELRSFLGSMDVGNKAVKIMVTPLNVVISFRDIPYKDEDYKEGMSLKTSHLLKNSTSCLTYIKSSCYIENILEKNRASQEGFNDALFFNEKGYLTETSCSNIFIVKNNKIFTPKIENGLLHGIIRQWVIESFFVEERDILYKDLEEADEVFITNSLMGIMKVSRIDKITYSKDAAIKKIMKKYNDTLIKIGG